MEKLINIFIFLFLTHNINGQSNSLSKVWIADNSNGTFKNPILHGDYSDPDYAFISLVKKADGNHLSFNICKNADKGDEQTVQDGKKINSTDIYFRVTVSKVAVCNFSYSQDGNLFESIGEPHIAKPGHWVGAKVGLFCTRATQTNDSGFADVDWFRIEQIK